MSASSSRPTIEVRSIDRLILVTLVVLLSGLVGVGCQSENSSDDVDGNAIIANFTEDPTTSTPNTTVQFTDTSTGDVKSYSWDFGPFGKSTDRNPQVTYDAVGSYSVSLTVFGPTGTSTATKPGVINIGDVPVAGFSCVKTVGYVPVTVVCLDESVGATSVLWNFGDGSSSTERNTQHTYTSGGSFEIDQTVSNDFGDDTVPTPVTVEAIPLEIVANPTSGAAPVDVLFTAATGGTSAIFTWSIDGEIRSGRTVSHRFDNPGVFLVELVAVDLVRQIVGEISVDYVVDYGPAMADFAPSPPEGPGPLAVTLNDESTGEVDAWEWNFGDGTECVYPAPAVPDPDNPVTTCDSSSPSHTYEALGTYDVTLTVTGPGASSGSPPVVSTTTTTDAVRVYILDPSFELQTADQPIAGAWTSLRPDDALEDADQIALSDAQGADSGMPTDGSLWAVLDGLGTDGSTPLVMLENGISQSFLRPFATPVLEFDYALLYNEPPTLGASPDAVTATVSDGTTTVEIPSAEAEVPTPYIGPSLRYPMRDGTVVRSTPPRTASINLEGAFPGASADTLYTLTIRVGNAVNAFRSPRAYVDNIRFTEPANPIAASFFVVTDPAIAGESVEFLDETCLDPVADSCMVPTSWRWDFDIASQMLTTPPPSSGSGEPDPIFVFPTPGDYLVSLLARVGDQESQVSMFLAVIGSPTAAFDFSCSSGPPCIAGEAITFTDASTTNDPINDPITGWSWDFGGWGNSTDQNPAPVVIGQVGDWPITLTITTNSGRMDTIETIVTTE